MRRRFRSKPSASMVVAFMALLLALGGTAVALPGSNTVTSGDIRAGAVGTSDIKNNSVRGRDIRNSTIAGRDVRNNSLGGADINEGTLAAVPRALEANTADTAGRAGIAGSAFTAGEVNGVSFRKIFYSGSCSGGETELFNGGGLVLTFDRDDSDIEATTSVANSILHVVGDDHGTYYSTTIDEFDPGTEEDAFGNDDDQSGLISYTNPNGNVVNVQITANDESDMNDCVVWGTASVS